MLFSSFTFLCFFLPLVFVLYYVLPSFFRNVFLLAASLFFYAWGEPRYIICMLGVISLVYVSARALSWYQSAWTRRLLVGLTVSAVLMILFFFKYLDFSLLTVNAVFKTDLKLLSLVLPIGISFYSFQAISYLIDVARGNGIVAQKDFLKLALYISLFPQLIAGPIVRYQTICTQLNTRYPSVQGIYRGFQRFIMGLAKKVIIANTLGVTVDRIFVMPIEHLSPGIAWIGMIFYTLQLYFDFSGYSDMAIGLGRMFGFKFLENFNYPYRSRSITAFWRRWHISLSSWFRQYVYFPLGGSRNGIVRTSFNLGLIFLLTGLWHGAAWTFIIWGVWHGFFMILEKGVTKPLEHIKQHLQGSFGGVVFQVSGHIYALLIVMMGWVLFRSESVTYAVDYLSLLVGAISYEPDFGLSYYVQSSGIFMACLGAALSVGAGQRLLFIRSQLGQILFSFFLWILLFIMVILLSVSSYNPFIYFRF